MFEMYARYVLLAVVVIFALFAISRSYLRLKHGNESMIEFLFWTGLWSLIIIIVLFPSLTYIPARIFGIGRGIDVLVYFGLIFLFYSTYRTYAKIEKLEQEMTVLVRQSAIEKKKKKR